MGQRDEAGASRAERAAETTSATATREAGGRTETVNTGGAFPGAVDVARMPVSADADYGPVPQPGSGSLRGQGTPQYTEGEGRQPLHTHPAVTHTHDHYHVSHH